MAATPEFDPPAFPPVLDADSEGLRRRLRELELMYRMTDAVGRAMDIGGVYQEALNGLQDALSADRLSILLFDPDGVLRFKAWRGLSDGYRAAVEGHTPWSPDAVDPEPITVPNATTDPSLGGIRETILGEGIRALAFVPLGYQRRLLGKFMIYYDEPHVFTTDELRLAQAIAGQVAFAIARVRDVQALRRRERHAAFLAEASHQLALSLDYRRTLDVVAELATRDLADWCNIYMLEQPDRLVRVAGAARGDREQEMLRWLQGVIMTDPRAPVMQVVRTGEPIIVERVDPAMLEAVAAGNPDHLELLRQLRPTGGMALPLIARGRVIGAIALTSTRPGGPSYAAEDVALARELAQRAALAVDSAMLYRAAEEANSAKTQFIATMSHELRTPLNAIIGYADLLEHEVDGELTDAQLGHVRRLRACASHLRGIIEEILNFSRLEAGREELELETADLGRLVEESAALVEPAIRARGIALVIRRPDEPVLADVDTGKLRQVMVNLVSNALKFTERGHIEVSVRTEADAAEIRVADTGSGIPPEHVGRIFEAFTQVDQSRTRRAGGTGLGLAVSRRYVELMQGRITVESELGRGSTFTVTLPLRQPETSM